MESISFQFNAATKADEVAYAYQANIQGKFVIVTGGNGGIGLETARVLAKHGAKVVICSRNLKNGEDAAKKIKDRHSDADVTSMQLDLASLKSIRSFASAYLTTGKPLHLLINNAGIMACPRSLTEDGFESQMGVNHLGHFELTQLMLPRLISSGSADSPSRVINLSSCANWLFPTKEGVLLDDMDSIKYYNSWERYGESKLASNLFSKELTLRMKAQGHHVISMSVHPGVINSTNLNQNTDLANMWSFVTHLYAAPGGLLYMATTRMKTIPEGAATSVFVALSPDVVPGEFYADCHLSDKVHPQANDAAACSRFWDVSEQRIKSAVSATAAKKQ